MEERFDLAPWELAPDSPENLEGVAQARITTNWLGDEREFLLREVEVAPEQFIVFAREVDSEDEGNYVLYNSRCAWVSVEMSWRTRAFNAANLILKAQHCLAGRWFFVCVRLEEKQVPAYVIVNNEEQAIFQWLYPRKSDRDFERSLPFRWPCADLAHAPSPVWLARLRSGLEQPLSVANFALRWLQLDFDTRANVAMVCRRGSYRELLQVMKWVLICDSDISWFSFEWHWEFDFLEHGEEMSQWLWSQDGKDEQRNSDFCAQWRMATLGWFGAHLNQELLESHRCVQMFCGDNHELMCVSASPPTQHERLEAALRLRDWARGKVPDELLQTLL